MTDRPKTDDQATWKVITSSGQWRVMLCNGMRVLVLPHLLSWCRACKSMALSASFKPPDWGAFRFEQAMKEMGIRRLSRSRIDAQVCVECAEGSGPTFECELCHEPRRESEIQESFGDEDFLCVTCYETVSAKKWGEAVAALTEAHRYDYQ